MRREARDRLSPHRIKSGYVVEGVATGSLMVETWHAPDITFANQLAETLCKGTGEEVDIYKYIGTWKRQDPPVEFVPVAED